MLHEKGFAIATAVTVTKLLLPKPIIDQEYLHLGKEGQFHTTRKSFVSKELVGVTCSLVDMLLSNLYLCMCFCFKLFPKPFILLVVI